MSIAQQMQQLYTQFGEMAGITIELHKNLLAVHVENDKACATVFLQGAQVSHYKRTAQPPVIWCSPSCDYQEGHSLRGGIPVCWPWFGDLSRNPAAVKQQVKTDGTVSSHGFVRNLLWELENVEVLTHELTRLTLKLTLSDNEVSLWPYASSLCLTVLIGEQLNLTLTVTNLSTETVAFSSALHSYFAVSNIENIAINGLENCAYIDCIDNWKPHIQQEAITIDQEVDRIYQGSVNNISLLDSQRVQKTSIQSQGSNSAVIWNPWIEKSKTLSQFDDEAYKEMLCIETANIAEDYIQLPNGDSHTLNLCIKQEPYQ